MGIGIWRGLIREYREYLPACDDARIVTLCEGNTPLAPAARLARRIAQMQMLVDATGEASGRAHGGTGVPRACRQMPEIDIYLKLEGSNPTGSFKDRGMTLAVSKAVEAGSSAVICASTGNTSASAAAYSARAGLRCIVVVPEGAVAIGKLAQAMMHGAEVVAIKGNFDAALAIVRQLADASGITLVNSINPYRIEGQSTAAFEVVDQLRDAPDYLLVPVGNAGNITAYWKGFKEYRARGRCARLPRMIGYQAAGAAPIVRGEPVSVPDTVATAIRIGNPANWAGARAAADESGGFIDSVTDGEILEAYRLLAQSEGIFAEPASCAPLAGLVKMAREGRIRDGQSAVVVLTGHGLKDPETAIARASATRPVVTAGADADEISRLLRV